MSNRSFSRLVIYYQNNYHDITNITDLPTFTLYLDVSLPAMRSLARPEDMMLG